MRRLLGPLATIGIISTVVSAFAGDRPTRLIGPSQDAHQSAIRPPALIPSSQGYLHSVATPKTSSTDQHVAEFLLWKKQHAPPIGRVGSR
jgi:hypothetical protein